MSAAHELYASLIADDAFVCIGAFPGDDEITVYTRSKLTVPSHHQGWPIVVKPIWRVRHAVNQEAVSG